MITWLGLYMLIRYTTRRSYVPPVKIGETMRAGGLGSVMAVGTAVKSLKLGDKVEGTLGRLVRHEHRCNA